MGGHSFKAFRDSKRREKVGVWGHSWVDVDLHMFAARTVPDSNLGCLKGQLLSACPLQLVAAGHTYRFGWMKQE